MIRKMKHKKRVKGGKRMFCSSCGKETIADTKFCAYCGKELAGMPGFGTIQLRCKSCNGSLTVDEGKKVLSCPYCQSKELIVESEEVIKQRIKSDAYKDIETVKQDTYREVELEKQRVSKEIEQMRQQAKMEIEQLRQKAYRDVEVAKAKKKGPSDPYMNTIKITLLGVFFIILSWVGLSYAVSLGSDSDVGVTICMVAIIVFFLGVGLVISAIRRRRLLDD